MIQFKKWLNQSNIKRNSDILSMGLDRKVTCITHMDQEVLEYLMAKNKDPPQERKVKHSKMNKNTRANMKMMKKNMGSRVE